MAATAPRTEIRMYGTIQYRTPHGWETLQDADIAQLLNHFPIPEWRWNFVGIDLQYIRIKVARFSEEGELDELEFKYTDKKTALPEALAKIKALRAENEGTVTGDALKLAAYEARNDLDNAMILLAGVSPEDLERIKPFVDNVVKTAIASHLSHMLRRLITGKD